MKILRYDDDYRKSVVAIAKKVFGYNNPVGIKYIAIDNDKVIGYVSYYLYDSKNAHLHELVTIVPGKQIGAKLLRKALNRLRNVENITLHVDRKKPKLLIYYKKFGFKLSKTPSPGGNYLMILKNDPMVV